MQTSKDVSRAHIQLKVAVPHGCGTWCGAILAHSNSENRCSKIMVKFILKGMENTSSVA